MKVCVMTTVHQPNDVRINKELKTLKDASYEVTYIAPEGDFNLKNTEFIPIKRFDNRLARIIKGPKIAFKKALKVDADIYHFHDPELINVGLKLKKRGKKVIYDIHEYYSTVILEKQWIPRFLRKPLSRWFSRKEEKSVKQFDGIIAVVKEQLENYDNPNYAILPNYPEISVLRKYALSTKNKKDSAVSFVYIGSIDEDRAIAETIEAFKLNRDKSYDIKYHLIGPCYTKRLNDLINVTSEKDKNFRYYGRLPQNEAIKIASKCDVGFLVVHKCKSKQNSSPLKMFEYLTLGIPIIASDFEKYRRILDHDPCALYVDPDSPEDIAEKMKTLIENKELRIKLSRQAKENSIKYSWDSVSNRLIKLYEKIYNDQNKR